MRFLSPDGMLAAEESARDLAARLLPWKAVCNNKVVWYFTNNPYECAYFGAPIEFASDTVRGAMADFFDVTHFLDYLPELRNSPLPPGVLSHFASYETWFLVSDLRLPMNDPGSFDFSAWESFANLRNPFEPLMDIWLRGYRIVPEFTDKDPFIRLYTRTATPHELPLPK